jgi:hypothetical protein
MARAGENDRIGTFQTPSLGARIDVETHANAEPHDTAKTGYL